MAKSSTSGSVDDYMADLTPETRKAVEALRTLIKASAPAAMEKISYAIPAFTLNGKYLLYMAGWKKHVALYPITDGLAHAFDDELQPYRSGKASLRFPLGKPMPEELIRRIVEFRVAELSGNGP